MSNIRQRNLLDLVALYGKGTAVGSEDVSEGPNVKAGLQRHSSSLSTLVGFYGMVELAALAKFIPWTFPIDFLEAVKNDVARIPTWAGQRDSNFLLIELLRLRLEGRSPIGEVDLEPVPSLFMTYIEVARLLAGQDLGSLFRFLSERSVKPWNDFLDILQDPVSFIAAFEVPLKERSFLQQSVVKFQEALILLEELGRFLEECKGYSVFQAGVWQHARSILPENHDLVRSALLEGLRQFLGWRDSLGLDEQSFLATLNAIEEREYFIGLALSSNGGKVIYELLADSRQRDLKEQPSRLRNVAVTGHKDSGKTSLVSTLLYVSGATPRLLKVDDGNTVTDFDPQEMTRGISIGVAPAFALWKGYKVNLLDCPGYGLFFTETRAGMRAADAVVLTIDAVVGVEVNFERVWKTAGEMDLPVHIHLTKMDQEGADFERVVEALRERFGPAVLPVQVPIGDGADFEGVVDLMRGQAIRFERDGEGKKEDVPEELAGKASVWREALIEAVVELEWELTSRYLEEGEIQQESLETGLARAVHQRLLFPVTAGSDLHSIGASALLDAIVAFLPSPADRTFRATDQEGNELAARSGPRRPHGLPGIQDSERHIQR